MNLKTLGNECREFRKEMGYKQYEVAREIGTSSVNVSHFENGRNDSALIYNWYVMHGFVVGEWGID